MTRMKTTLPLAVGALTACATYSVSRGDFSLQRAASTAEEVGAVAERIGSAHAPPPPALAVLVATLASLAQELGRNGVVFEGRLGEAWKAILRLREGTSAPTPPAIMAIEVRLPKPQSR